MRLYRRLYAPKIIKITMYMLLRLPQLVLSLIFCISKIRDYLEFKQIERTQSERIMLR